MTKRQRILIVDDEPGVRSLLNRLLGRRAYDVVCAEDSAQAIELLEQPFDLVLLDVNMPGPSGLDTLAQIRRGERTSEIPIIIMTAEPNANARRTASQAGANDFLTKPFDPAEVEVRVRAALERQAVWVAQQRQQLLLESLVQRRTAALQEALHDAQQTNERLQSSYMESLHRLAVAAEYKDEMTGFHIQRVGQICAALGRAKGLDERQVELLREAGPLHDVGKIGIPDQMLHKPGRLSPDERAEMKLHTIIGARILGESDADVIQAAQSIALTHHEWWNGEGYPYGIKGLKIPLFGRICAVADVYDALTSRRPYKEPWSNDRALSVILDSRGTQFDAELVDLFVGSFAEIERIQEQYQDEANPDTLTRITVAQVAAQTAC